MMLSIWVQLDPNFDMRGLGFLPGFLRPRDGRTVKEQLEARYAHGGGWRPIQGFTMRRDRTLDFPDDEPFEPSAMTVIGDETVIFYAYCELISVIQPDGSFEVARVN